MKKRSILVTGLLVVFVFSIITIQGNAFPIVGMTIEGIITDSQTGNPIANAKVSLIVDGVTNGYTYSDGYGDYEITYNTRTLLLNPIPGLLKVEKSGYYTEYVSTTIPPLFQGPTVEDVSLTPIPPPVYTYTVRGYVKNGAGYKLGDAIVVLTGNGIDEEHTTTITGLYTFSMEFYTSGSKTFTLTCTREDYNLYTTTITFNPGILTKDIILVEDSSCHAPVVTNSNLHAIIIAGMGEPRFTRDALGMYNTLTTYYGLSADNAILITPLDTIDGESVPRDYETNKMSIHLGFNFLANSVGINDEVIVWWTGHGDPDKFLICDDEFSFSEEEEYLYVITADEMSGYLDGITCNETYIYLGPCQSGSFINDINDMDNRAIYTSCSTYGTGFVLDGHSLFPYATYRGLHPYLEQAIADTNNNGQVSLSELFVYCEYFVEISLAPYGYTQEPQSWVGLDISETSTYIGIYY